MTTAGGERSRSGSDVTITAGTITSAGAGHRVFEIAGTVNCNCNLSGVTLSGNGSDGHLAPVDASGYLSVRRYDTQPPERGTAFRSSATQRRQHRLVRDVQSINIATCTNTGISVATATAAASPQRYGRELGRTISNCTQRGARFGPAPVRQHSGAKNVTSPTWFSTQRHGEIGHRRRLRRWLQRHEHELRGNIDLQDVVTATLTDIRATGSSQMGINGRNVTDLILTNVEVDNNGNEALEDGIQIHNLLTTAQRTWSGLNLYDNTGRQLEIQNSSGTNNLVINSSSFIGETNAALFPSAATGAQGMLFSGSGGSTNRLSSSTADVQGLQAAFATDTGNRR